MRSAEEERNWERLAARGSASAPLFRELKIDQSASLAEVALTPNAGLVCLCGGTGIGKTAIMRLVHHSLTLLEEKPSVVLPNRFAGVGRSLTVDFDNVIHSVNAQDGYPHQTLYLDLSERVFLPYQYFTTNDLDVLKEGIAQKALSDRDVEHISSICEKRYQSIYVHEVETFDDVVLPYFVVRDEYREYDSIQMSTGELSAFYICWKLGTAQRGEIVLIEEPEGFLPPSAHRHMLNLIVDSAIRRGIGVVIATHSAAIVEHIPERYVFALKTIQDRATVATGSGRKRALRRLGLTPKKRVYLIVEDKRALEILHELVWIDGTLADYDFEIAIGKNGESGIRHLMNNMPNLAEARFIAILDGDQAADTDAEQCFLTLPLKGSPEEALLAYVRQEALKFAAVCGRDKELILDALEEHKGLNVHDRFVRTGKRLGLSAAAFTQMSTRFWASAAGNKRLLRAFVREIVAHTER